MSGLESKTKLKLCISSQRALWSPVSSCSHLWSKHGFDCSFCLSILSSPLPDSMWWIQTGLWHPYFVSPGLFHKIFFDSHFGGRSTTLILYFVSSPCFYLTIFSSPFIFSLFISCPLNIRVKSCLLCSPLYIWYKELFLSSGRYLTNSCWQRKEQDIYIQIYKWANEWIVYICFSHVRNLKCK